MNCITLKCAILDDEFPDQVHYPVMRLFGHRDWSCSCTKDGSMRVIFESQAASGVCRLYCHQCLPKRWERAAVVLAIAEIA